MINFDVPERIGIGLARGPASRLVADSQTLDYSGHTLNLASRLMDIARPAGVVVDGRFGYELLDEDLAQQFKPADVYLKGVSPNVPLPVYFTADHTKIPTWHEKPLDEEEWGHSELSLTLRQIRDYGPLYQVHLSSVPLNQADIVVKVRYPAVRSNRRIEGISSRHEFSDFTYRLDAGNPVITLNLGKLFNYLKSKRVRLGWSIEIAVDYRIR